jgi:hypothetical protein
LFILVKIFYIMERSEVGAQERIRDYVSWTRFECVCSGEVVAALTLAVGSDNFRKCIVSIPK